MLGICSVGNGAVIENERNLEYAPNKVIVGLKEEAASIQTEVKRITANPAISAATLF